MKLNFRRSVRSSRTAAAVLAATAVLAVAAPATAADPGIPGSQAPAVPLRVATYNIHAGAGEDEVFDLDRTAEAIRGLDADVVGLQEVDVHWGARSNFVDEAHALAEKLDMNVFFAPIYDMDPATQGGERRQFGVAVLSRYPVLEAENHDITRLSTQTPNPVPAPAPGFAEVTVNVKGSHVHVYDTHLDYRANPSVRKAQVADMLNVMAADSGPKVLVGDFNAGAKATELAPLWQQLRDANPNGGATYPAINPVNRIDFVTVSPDITVVGAQEVAAEASDHRPVVTDLELHQRGR
ncbi:MULTISPECIES: endonuclease/exonuclease/phosphatase family protein [unclassified Streptomyces]|uniref:endonuclease/exonuclease/phosphatase family protein n=1 Tax=unclassified Streptomyces TaxID=2593676 RepID=UPI0034310785